MKDKKQRWSEAEIGKRYGRLVILSYSHTSKWRQAYFLCVCDCGVKKVERLSSLKSNSILSCGCFAKEFCPTVGLKHGRSRDGAGSTYASWMSMNNRCYCNSHPQYKDYGGRNIYVCDRWKGVDGFNNFLSDMGERTTSKHTLDRIDNNGIYEPSNCRWATYKEQRRNTSRNVYVTINNETRCLKEWSELYQINYSTVQARVRKGIPIEIALTTPLERRIKSIAK